MERLIQVLIELNFLPEDLPEIRQIMTEIVNMVRSNETDTRGYRWHMNEGQDRVYIIQCFNSVEALVLNVNNAGAFLPRLNSISSITKWDIYGNVSEEMANRIIAVGQPFNLPMVIHRELTGFTREDLVVANLHYLGGSRVSVSG